MVNDEIEVTKEMIEAGMEAAEEFYIGDGAYLAGDEIIKAIFKATTKTRERFHGLSCEAALTVL